LKHAHPSHWWLCQIWLL